MNAERDYPPVPRWARVLVTAIISLFVVYGLVVVYAVHFASYFPDPATGRIYPVWSHHRYQYVTHVQKLFFDVGFVFVVVAAIAVGIFIIGSLVAKSRET